MDDILTQSIVIIPAFNEEGAIGELLDELRISVPGATVVVVNDCSEDRTAAVARQHGAAVLDLPCNLGVGGAVQAGFRYACDHGYRYVIRCDGDGQHQPSEIPKLVAGMQAGDADLVIGSRFLDRHDGSYKSTAFRSAGIRVLAWMLSAICKAQVTDPTSGFQMLNRAMLCCFSRSYPVDYPEPEALALLRRQGYRFKEVPANFRARTTGESSIHSWDALYYAFKVGLALVIDRARTVDPRLARQRLMEVP